MDVALVLVREQEDPHWDDDERLRGLTVTTLEAVRGGPPFDVAISTWWETALVLFDCPAERHASFVQSLEDRFYTPDEPERFGAALTWDLPVSFLTEAAWIAETLGDLRPDAPVHLVRNGIDKDVFPVPAAPPGHDGPLRVLVEGYANVWFKGVNDAIAATGLMGEPHTLTVVAPNRDGLRADGADRVLGPVTQREMSELYAEHDVLVKLSRVEGMYGPPLEAFHRGATCVTTEVTGSEMYIAHGVNALVCDWDDLRGTARQLDLLARDRELLARLRAGAIETARAWPSWDEAAAEMAVALRTIRESPAPDPAAAAARMMADVRTAMAEHALLLTERAELRRSVRQLERIKRLPGIRWWRRVKYRAPWKWIGMALGPVKRRVLGG